jgi:Fe-S cluster assembly protein SufD
MRKNQPSPPAPKTGNNPVESSWGKSYPLPSPALESWKFTNLPRAVAELQAAAQTALSAPTGNGLRMTDYGLCTTPGCLEAALPVVAGPQAVFHNGTFMPAYSGSLTLAPNLTFTTQPPSQTTAEEAPPTDNGLRMTDDDALDTLPAPQLTTLTVRGKTLLPLHLIHAASGPPNATHIHITLEENATLTLIEHHVAAPRFATWNHTAVTLELGQGAALTHSVLQMLPPKCLLTRRTRLHAAPQSTYTATQFQLGANLSRLETHAHLTTNTRFTFTGLSLSRHSQHHGTLLHITHADENNQTHIRQRNLADDAAHAVFQGKFHVAQTAQKTNAYMHCHNLLLSDTARASHKPELEIYADDVKCSHGAATGGLNAEHLFYLATRGLTPHQSRTLLTAGYAEEFLATFPEPLRAPLHQRLQTWLTEAPHTPTEAEDFTPIEGEWLTQRAETEHPRLTPEPEELHDE